MCEEIPNPDVPGGKGNSVKVPREIDFVVNRGNERIYIQSAYGMDTDEKKAQELKPFSLTGDSFRKIIVRNDIVRRGFDENGVLNIALTDFLLDPTSV